MANFDEAIKTILKNEGGLVSDPDDPGGTTKFGISKRSYPNEDIPNLSIERAKLIYKEDFWDRLNLDTFRSQIVAEKIFDISVNIGIRKAIIILQRALRAATGIILIEDGIMGDATLSTVKEAEEIKLHTALKSEVAAYYRMLVQQDEYKDKFLKGWLNRAYS